MTDAAYHVLIWEICILHIFIYLSVCIVCLSASTVLLVLYNSWLKTLHNEPMRLALNPLRSQLLPLFGPVIKTLQLPQQCFLCYETDAKENKRIKPAKLAFLNRWQEKQLSEKKKNDFTKIDLFIYLYNYIYIYIYNFKLWRLDFYKINTYKKMTVSPAED